MTFRPIALTETMSYACYKERYITFKDVLGGHMRHIFILSILRHIYILSIPIFFIHCIKNLFDENKNQSSLCKFTSHKTSNFKSSSHFSQFMLSISGNVICLI